MATFYDTPPYSSGSWDNAATRWDRPYNYAYYLIKSNEERAVAAEANIDGLLASLENLSQVTFPTLPSAGQLPDPNQGLPTAPSYPPIADINVPPAPVAPAIGGITADPAPVFNPTPVTVTLPAAPAPIVVGLSPTAPTLTDAQIPTAPTITLPTIPTIDPASLPALSAFSYSEPVYTPAVANELRAQILAWLQGGTGLPAAVEQALFARAYDRQEQINFREEQRIRADWASRGWQLPPGAMAKQIGAVREQGMLQTSETAREILVKAAEWEIENLRQAVAHGISFEKLLMDSFQQIAERAFNVAKYRVEAEVARLNAMIAAHNLVITLYEAQLKGAGFDIEIYKTKMEAARIHTEVSKAKIEAYKADISAWAEKIAARKIEFDAYETQVKAETAKIGLLETEARAFAATVDAYKSGNDVKIQNVKIQIEQLDAAIKRHNLLLDVEKTKVQTQLSKISTQTDLYKAQLSGYGATLDAKIKIVMADFDAKTKQYDALVSRAAQEAQLKMEAVKGAANIKAQLAAGAASASHITASINAGVSGSIASNTTYYYDKS